MFEQPHDETRGEVSLEVVHDQQQTQRWQLLAQRWLDGETCPPALRPAQLSASSSTLAGGNASKMASSSASNQACKTTFGQLVTPLTRTCPVAGWNSVISLAVPCRTYSCGNEQADRRAANGCRAEE